MNTVELWGNTVSFYIERPGLVLSPVKEDGLRLDEADFILSEIRSGKTGGKFTRTENIYSGGHHVGDYEFIGSWILIEEVDTLSFNRD